MKIKLIRDYTGVDCVAVTINLDDLVLWFESCSLCWRVLINSPDELALLRLLAVQIEAVGILYFLNVAKTRAQTVSFLLKIHISHISQSNKYKRHLHEALCFSNDHVKWKHL